MILREKNLRNTAGIWKDFAFTISHFPNMYNYQGKQLQCNGEKYYEISADDIPLTMYEFKSK